MTTLQQALKAVEKATGPDELYEANEALYDAARSSISQPGATVRAYTVSVDSSGYSADHMDTFIVMALSEEDAKLFAVRFVKDHYPMRDVDEEAEAYAFVGEGRVLGRLINSDEEG